MTRWLLLGVVVLASTGCSDPNGKEAHVYVVGTQYRQAFSETINRDVLDEAGRTQTYTFQEPYQDEWYAMLSTHEMPSLHPQYRKLLKIRISQADFARIGRGWKYVDGVFFDPNASAGGPEGK